jgi:hypothetical protein
MRLGEERRQRHAFGSECDEPGTDAVKLPPCEETLTEVASERAVDLGVEMRRNYEPFTDQQGRSRPASSRPREYLDGKRRVECDQSSRPSSRRPSRTRSAPVFPPRSIGGDFPTSASHSARVGRAKSSVRISITYWLIDRPLLSARRRNRSRKATGTPRIWTSVFLEFKSPIVACSLHAFDETQRERQVGA